MAPKKSRRAKKGDPDSDDELSTQASTAASEGDKPAPKKASKKKVNKKNRKAGDWSDDEPDVLLTVDTNGEEAPAAKPTASFAALGTVEQSEDEKEEEDSRASPNKPSKAALGFAALQEEEPDSDAELVVEEEEPVALTKPSAKRKGKKGKGRSQLDDFEQSLKVARIESVQPHPNADRLKVCSVNTGSQTFKVVTNAPNAAEGKLVIFAGVGCVLPSTSTRVEQATLRGVESFGMLCSAFDIGWASEPDGLLVDLPAEGPLQEGDDCPSEPIQANGGSAHEVETEEADEELAALASLPKPKQKKKKSKKDTGFADGDGEDVVDPIANGSANGAFSALGSGDENAAQPMETSSSMFGGKKKKKSKKDIGFADVAIEDEETPSAPVEDEEGPSHSQPAGAFSALETDGGDAPDPKEESSIFGGRKKKKSKQVVDADLLLAALEDDSTAGPAGDLGSQEPAVGLNKSKSEPPPEDKAVKGKKQKGKAAAIDEENLDALLAQFSTEKSAAEGAGDAAVDSKKKKKKKGKDKGTDDLDAALAELGISTEPAQAAVPSAEAAEVSAEFAAPPAQHADEAAEASGEAANVPADVSTSAAADAGEEDGKELTAAQKKKLKKKAKEKAKKAGGQDDDEAEEEPAAAVAKKGGKKQSAAVRALQEKLAAERAAQEAAQKAEEDRIRREEEEALRAEEEAKRKEEEKQRRKEERLKNRAELKRQGLLLTGKAKQEAQRLEAMREQILKNAGADLSELADASREKKKVVYGKKRQAFKKVESEQSAEAAQEAEAAQKEAEAAEQRRREEEQRRAEEAALAAEAEAAAAKAEEEAAAQEEESDELGWEDMDLDAVKLPGDKPEPEPTVEPQPTPAEEAKQTSTSKKAAALPNGKAAVHQAQKTNGPARAAAAEESDEESEEESSEEEDTSEASSSGEETSDDESEDSDDAREERIRAAKAARESRTAAAKAAGKADDLRSPICCILGHVDTGKTKLLDNIRRTSVQEGEAGGITQQIGATYVPGEALRKRTEPVRKGREFDLKLPGLLIIDTPGHESFTNLRSRGSSLCDIAILVVDIMHGLEPQTIESINLLKQRKTPFIVALNKVDRMFEWEQHADSAVQESLNSQKPHVRAEFEEKMKRAVLNLNEQGLNVALYWKNPDPRKYVNIVPTSAISGEGIPDMLQLLVQLTQKMMAERLMFISELQCTVLEVKVIEGLGTTIDVVLVNGVLHEGDQIVLCGLQGPIVTTIRSLLTPHPLKELRVKGQYHHHKEIKAAQGIKIAAQNLESAVAGTQMLVVGKGDDIEDLKEEVMEDMQDIFSSVDRSGEGVCVQASTLGSLEALLEFLRSDAVKIPVSGINIGPIHKKDVMRANVMMEKGNKKYGCILAFDVSVTKEAREMAEELGVRIFTADIIYHLFDQFNAYLKQTKEEEQQAASGEAVFPCILKILPNCVFNAKDPIVLGVDVEEGIAKVGTPLCVPSRGGIMLGKIASLELNHKAVDTAKAGESVAVKIEAGNSDEATKFYGRHFDLKDPLVSKISRRSIDLLKIHFKDALSRDDWRLVVKLKKTFNIGEKGI